MKATVIDTNQLSLFDAVQEPVIDPDDILTEKANNLLVALNEGRRNKDIFEPHLYTQVKNVMVLIAVNRNRELVGNIIDLNGDTPKGLCVCWRHLRQIKEDLDKYYRC